MTTRLPCPAPAFSSPLASGLQRFLESKRAAGYRYDTEAQALGRLDRFLEGHVAPDDPVISFDVIRDFVARRGHESDTTRGHRLSLIRQVCRFLALEQPRTAVPGPRFLPIVRAPFPGARVESGGRPPLSSRLSDRAHRALGAAPADDARDGLGAAVPHGAAGR